MKIGILGACEKFFAINGKIYMPPEGAEYVEILGWVAKKYKYFDYELWEE